MKFIHLSDPHLVAPGTELHGLDPVRSGLGYAVFSIAMTAGRLTGDRIVAALGARAVLALTDRDLVLVDDRTWRPVSERFPLDAGLQVQGWQDDRTASLTLVTAGRQLVVDQIADRPLAVEMAQRIRYRVGG